LRFVAGAIVGYALVMASIGLTSTTPPTRAQRQTLGAVPVHVLARGSSPRVCSGPCYYLISKSIRFRTFWYKGLAGMPMPQLNFSKQVVVVASEGFLGLSGFNSIDVQKVVRTGRELKIIVHQVDGDGGPSIYNTPDWPFVVASLPRPSTKVQFIVRADRYICSGLNQVLCGSPSESLLPGGRCNPVQPNFRSALCYSPSALPNVEKFLNRKILDPSATIGSITHLRLRRIIVFLPQITTTASADVYFIYGHMPSSIAGVNMSQPKPTFVVVRENTVGEAYTGSPPVPILEKSTFHLHTNSPPSQTVSTGPWQFGARVPHQRRWITVMADAQDSVVQEVGDEVLARMVTEGSK